MGLTLAILRPQPQPPPSPQGLVTKNAPEPPPPVEEPSPREETPAERQPAPQQQEMPSFLEAEEVDLRVIQQAKKEVPQEGPPDVVDLSRHIEWFTVHVESFRNEQTARQRSLFFKDRGFDAITHKVNIPGKGIFYRVYVGRVPSREEAEQILQRLVRDFQLKEARILPAPETPKAPK